MIAHIGFGGKEEVWVLQSPAARKQAGLLFYRCFAPAVQPYLTAPQKKRSWAQLTPRPPGLSLEPMFFSAREAVTTRP